MSMVIWSISQLSLAVVNQVGEDQRRESAWLFRCLAHMHMPTISSSTASCRVLVRAQQQSVCANTYLGPACKDADDICLLSKWHHPASLAMETVSTQDSMSPVQMLLMRMLYGGKSKGASVGAGVTWHGYEQFWSTPLIVG